MQTIRKFPLLTSLEPQTVTFPACSRVVHVGPLGEDACLWVMSDTEDADVEHTFTCFRDDEKVPLNLSYVGSYIHPEDRRFPACVVRATPVHIFEGQPEK